MFLVPFVCNSAVSYLSNTSSSVARSVSMSIIFFTLALQLSDGLIQTIVIMLSCERDLFVRSTRLCAPVSDPDVRSRRFFGVSIARMRPRLMIATRSHSVSTSARLCEVKRIVTGGSCCASDRIISRMRAAASGSSERVGSSSNSTGGLDNIARATASRCLFPVESSPKRRRATSSSSSFANRSLIRCFAARSLTTREDAQRTSGSVRQSVASKNFALLRSTDQSHVARARHR